MKRNNVVYQPVGIIHSPFKTIEGVPIQPCAAKGIQGKVELNREYTAGLNGLGEFSHIILIYHLHLSKGHSLEVVPFLDKIPHGVFATRAPKRPNPIGISLVKIIRIEDNSIIVENIDIVDGTPLLDIKPYVGLFDRVENEKIGWYQAQINKAEKTKSDSRFK
jgi:tRNA-Thr(GGU) m(6)t(6)A37 methyltransferase TsaA